VVASGANLYVTDTYNHTIRQIVIAGAVVSTFAGTAGASGSANGIVCFLPAHPPGVGGPGDQLGVVDQLQAAPGLARHGK
jgi:hypothetical protein